MTRSGMHVAIVDYGMGNFDSVARAVEECGGRPVVTGEAREVATAAAVILPGVGAFRRGMENIRARGLEDVLKDDVVGADVPLLGVCLGMQLLATAGSEGGETPGLGLVPGRVERISPSGGERVPHVGWNEVTAQQEHRLFEGIEPGRDFYFVHSYELRCDEPEDVLATVPYGGEVVAAVAHGCVVGVQFHPEKSQKTGFQLLRNFLAMAERPVEPPALSFSRPRR